MATVSRPRPKSAKPVRRAAPSPFNWGLEISKAINSRMDWTNGAAYDTVRETVCNMIAAVLSEITAGVDAAMDKALELEAHSPTFMIERELKRRRGVPEPESTPPLKIAKTSKRQRRATA